MVIDRGVRKECTVGIIEGLPLVVEKSNINIDLVIYCL
jgi:hypothetical protein